MGWKHIDKYVIIIIELLNPLANLSARNKSNWLQSFNCNWCLMVAKNERVNFGGYSTETLTTISCFGGLWVFLVLLYASESFVRVGVAVAHCKFGGS